MLDGSCSVSFEVAHFVLVAVDVEVLRLPVAGSLRMTPLGLLDFGRRRGG
jgi:hypothetical protein